MLLVLMHAKAVESIKFEPMSLQVRWALRFTFSIYYPNADWSRKYQRNIKLSNLNSGHFISISYDFDLSGLVHAPYSLVSLVGDEELSITNVRERLYRGWCRSEEVTQFVRIEFLSKQAALLAIPDLLTGQLPTRI